MAKPNVPILLAASPLAATRSQPTKIISIFPCDNNEAAILSQSKVTSTPAACNSKQVPEEILFETSKEILSTTTFDEKIFKKKIEKIIVKNDNILTYVFKDGTSKDIKWENKSRSLSWTPEKKALARQKTLEQQLL